MGAARALSKLIDEIAEDNLGHNQTLPFSLFYIRFDLLVFRPTQVDGYRSPPLTKRHYMKGLWFARRLFQEIVERIEAGYPTLRNKRKPASPQ